MSYVLYGLHSEVCMLATAGGLLRVRTGCGSLRRTSCISPRFVSRSGNASLSKLHGRPAAAGRELDLRPIPGGRSCRFLCSFGWWVRPACRGGAECFCCTSVDETRTFGRRRRGEREERSVIEKRVPYSYYQRRLAVRTRQGHG